MSKIKSEMATRCEFALMGRVVPCNSDEVQAMTEYILSAIGKDPDKFPNILGNRIRKYSKSNQVKFITVNVMFGEYKVITYLLEAKGSPKPFKTDYGTGYPCSFCYALNTDADDCSEFGDCFFEKRGNFYFRVS